MILKFAGKEDWKLRLRLMGGIKRYSESCELCGWNGEWRRAGRVLRGGRIAGAENESVWVR